MISRTKFLSAAVIAVALVATVAVARTVHTYTAPADQVRAGKVIGTAPGEATRYPRHGIIVCGGLTTAADCEKIEMMLPM